MSQEAIIKLKRRDKIGKISSYLNIYDVNSISKIDKNNNLNILRIIKKSILGCNFYYSYSKNDIFASAIANFVIINTCFVIFPQILFNSLNLYQTFEDIEKIFKEENNTILTERNDFLFRLSISNFIDVGILFFISIYFKYKENKINQYLQKCTQCAIKEENDALLKDKYFCQITDNEFDIEIKKIKNNFNDNKNNEEYFFKYVINFPNVTGISKFLYNKSFTNKENEIINDICNISSEIDFKYKKKLTKFIFIIASVLVCIPVFSLISGKKKLDIINYIGIFLLFLFVQLNIFFDNKKEQINYVNLLNERYIKEGYFIYINNDIISIFNLKEEYKINEDITQIRKLNEKFMVKYGISF